MTDAFRPHFDEQFLAKYSISKRIGEGGMGTVYRAVQRDLGRTVAVKCIIPAISGGFESSDIARFKREARVLTKFRHPNIVEVYDFGISTTPYLVIEYLEGKSLREYLDEKGSRSLKEALPIAEQILAGIEHAHQNKVLHRDLKPGNIFCLDDGRVKLLDFGLAKREDQKTQITVTGTGVGTPYYCSAEQMQGDPLTPASDLFSFGVIFYEMLSGRLPYKNDTFDGVYHEKMTGDLLSLKLAAKRQLPPRVVQVVDGLLHPDPDARPTIEEIVNELWQKSTTPKERRASAETVPRHDIEQSVADCGKASQTQVTSAKKSHTFALGLSLMVFITLFILYFLSSKGGSPTDKAALGRVDIKIVQVKTFSAKLKVTSALPGRLFLSLNDSATNEQVGPTGTYDRAKEWEVELSSLRANHIYAATALVRDKRTDWRSEKKVCTKKVEFIHSQRCFIGKSPTKLFKGPREFIAVAGDDQVIACADMSKDKADLWSTWSRGGGGMWMCHDESHLYALALNFMLRAYKWSDGNVTWQRQLNPKTDRLFHFVNDTLIFLVKKEGLLAIDCKSGKDKWKLEGVDLTVPWTICAGSVLVPSRLLDFHRLEADTGKPRDIGTFLGTSKRAPVAYLSHGDELYFASEPIFGSKENLLIGKLDESPRLAIDVPGHIAVLAADKERIYAHTNTPIGLYAYNQKDGSLLWRVEAKELANREQDNMLLLGDQLFLSTRSGQLTILNSLDGNTLWTTEEPLLVAQSPMVGTSKGLLLLFRDKSLRFFSQE